MRTHPYEGKGPQVQVLISVAKRRLRHAVDRNRAKRQIREAYRLNKEILWENLPENTAIHLGFVWVADQPQDSALVHKTSGQPPSPSCRENQCDYSGDHKPLNNG